MNIVINSGNNQEHIISINKKSSLQEQPTSNNTISHPLDQEQQNLNDKISLLYITKQKISSTKNYLNSRSIIYRAAVIFISFSSSIILTMGTKVIPILPSRLIPYLEEPNRLQNTWEQTIKEVQSLIKFNPNATKFVKKTLIAKIKKLSGLSILLEGISKLKADLEPDLIEALDGPPYQTEKQRDLLCNQIRNLTQFEQNQTMQAISAYQEILNSLKI